MDLLARRFHETYERLAPDFGYETRRESAVPWEDVPEQNKALMIAVVTEVVGGAVEALRRYQALRAEGRYEDDPAWAALDADVVALLNQAGGQ